MPSHFIGSKSLDAEIYINFSDNSITMDYSKNNDDTSLLLDSNHSISYYGEWLDYPLTLRLKQSAKTVAILFLIFPIFMPIYTLVSTLFLNSRFGTGPSWHYADQRFKKWAYVNVRGLDEIITKIDSSCVKVHIPNNLYLAYEMSDDAAAKVISIRLVRSFLNHYRYGFSHEIRQSGWDLIFDFNGVPENSFVSVKYIL